MARRIFDVIEYPDEMRNEIVRRFPESGSGDFQIGSQVIVRESQNAVFFRDGRALDTFTAGRHTITTANIPILRDWIGKLFNERSPFTAEVYYVSMREFADQKWGTPQPIIVRNPGMGLGVALLQAFGSYSFAVSNAQQFVTQIVGAQGAYTTNDIQGRFRAMLLSKLADLLAELATKQGKSVPELIAYTEEIGSAMRAKVQDDFRAIGVTLKSFYVESIKPSSKSAEELRAMGMLDMQTYMQLQAADAMRDAAKNPGGGAGLTAGIGAGIGIGNIMGQAFQGGMVPPAGPGAPAAAPTAPTSGGPAPEVMNPTQAAAYLQVPEADIMQMIQGGQLKAKQVGSQYRISKKALDDFLAS
ncbi:MAG: helix-turn-helix domain-containing protein [Chloroflexi bacterium]|nr:helix-turn-helix domain-containing protein [Chloroflexota bacterium]